MANKKISELESRASLSLSDLMAVGDPSTGYLYKTTISDLKTLTGAGVVSFNGRFGIVNPAEGDYTLTQLGDVIITSAGNNDVLKYNGSNWVNTQLYTGTVAQYIDGTGAYQTFPTLLSSDRLVTNVRNTSGATITKGTVVYLNGSSGTLPTIAKAQANAESTSTGTYGVVQDNIANNANGYVVVIGNLTALDTSAYNAGDILWLSPTVAGGYTTTKPVAPNHAVYVGIVTRSSNTQGTIEVKIQNGYELDELHNVLITSVANNDVLVYETASSLWKNKAFSTLETDTLNSVTGRGNTTANDITVGSVTAAGLSNLLGQIKTFVTTGNIYMGANPTSATDAGFKLDVNGTTRLNGNTTVTGVLTGSDTIRSTNGTVTVSISYGSTAGIIGTTSNHSLEIRTNNTYRVGVSTAGVVNIANLIGTGSRMVVADSAGNLSTQAIPTSAVTSVFGRTGAVVAASGDYTTSQVTEGTNLYYTDARARAAITLTTTGSSGAATYSGGTLNIPTYTLAGLGGQAALSGTGFVKISGTTISYDNSTYLTTSSAASTYLPLAGGTLTGALTGTSATFNHNDAPTIRVQRNGGTDSNTVLEFTNASRSFFIGSNGTVMGLGGTSGAIISQPLQISSTGAATFSSSVTAGGSVGVGGTNTDSLFTINGTAGTAHARFREGSTTVGFIGGANGITTGANGSLAVRAESGLVLSGAGNSISMFINSSGNISVGTTSISNPISFTRLLNISGGDAALVLSNSNGTAKNWSVGALDTGSFAIYDGSTFRFSIASTGAATFSSSLNVTTTGTFGFQDYRTQATQKVLVLNAEGVSGSYAPALFNIYTKPGTTSNGIASIIIKSKYGGDAESGNLFEFKGDGDAVFTGNVKVKTLEVTNVGTDAGSSGLSTYMRITVNGQNYLIPLHGTP